MTTITSPAAGAIQRVAEALPPRPGPFARYLRETALLVGRGLRAIPRVPERLSDVTIQPIMFTLLFLYVFGSAIHVHGTYQDYLLPGLLGQSVAFGAIGAGVATSTDFSSGVVDRFRSLPVVRMSVISAQVIGQIIEQILGIVIVAGIGLALGWRPHLGGFRWLELVALMLLGLVAFTWVGVLAGMLIRSSDAMQGIGFAVMLPLSFLAGTFVPIAGMKLVPRAIAEWDPLSALVAAVRQVCQGTPSSGSLQLDHPVPAMIAWCVLVLIVCVPLALRRFRTASV
ncbi:MAG: ABC transporter permease [Streptosporangiaceae bacterium]|jgi:ABC transporter DrrB family efflux protein